MKIIRILCGMLVALLLLGLAGCTAGSKAVYSFPKGADSEYALYSTVVDYLNNGFRFDDLKDVYDLNLTIVSYNKQRDDDENFTLGMNYDEACALIAKLTDKAKANMPLDAEGYLDEEMIDYHPFITEFPETMQAQIAKDPDEFENFIQMYIYGVVYDRDRNDGEQPFNTDQTQWEKKGDGELTVERYSTDGYGDMYLNFPQVYEIDLGEYRDGNDVYYMGMCYVKINERYYFIGFTETWGSGAGG